MGTTIGHSINGLWPIRLVRWNVVNKALIVDATIKSDINHVRTMTMIDMRRAVMVILARTAMPKGYSRASQSSSEDRNGGVNYERSQSRDGTKKTVVAITNAMASVFGSATLAVIRKPRQDW